MTKFKVLKLNEDILIHLGMFSNQFPEKQSDGFFKSLRICHILFISMTFIVAGSLFAYRNSVQFTLALRTCTFTLGGAQAVCMLICFGLNLSKIRTVHFKLQELVDKSTDEGRVYDFHHTNIPFQTTHFVLFFLI